MPNTGMWKAFLLLQLATVAAFMVLLMLFANDDETSIHLRKPRSIKSDMQKDGTSGGMLREMHSKIHNLDSSVKNISLQLSSVKTKLDKISSQKQRQEAVRSEQLRMLGLLTKEFENLKRVLTGHGDMLENLEQLAAGDEIDENDFVLSNQTCGGVLAAHSGSILFFNTLRRREPLLATCIWTIHTNTRRVKITSSLTSDESSKKSSQVGAYIIEIIEKPVAEHGSAIKFETKITKVGGDTTHVICTGPIVYVVYMLPRVDIRDYDEYEAYGDSDYTRHHLKLKYVGLGKLAEKNTHFSVGNLNLSGSIGNFSEDKMESWMTSKKQANESYTHDHTSITLPIFHTKMYLQVSFKNGTCGHKDTSFIVVNPLNKNNAKFVDCCKQSCAGSNSLVSYDSPFIFIIRKRFQVPLNFEVNWQTEELYYSSSNSYVHCGEVVNGVSGSIRYRWEHEYTNGKRCVWTIMPQPGPRSFINIRVLSNGINDASDHLYMMELTDVNGTELSDGPKITHLNNYGRHTATSRELYIVFYSDSTQVGQGFSLTWESFGQLLKTDQHVMKYFTNIQADNGLSTSLLQRPFMAKSMYQVFMITPTTTLFELHLQINQTLPKLSSHGNCFDNDSLTVYTSVGGIFQKLDMNGTCNIATQVTNIEVPDSMAIIILKDKNPDFPLAAMNFSWREEYGELLNDHIIVDNDECGGVIKGDKGLLRYKTSSPYFNNENCIWLLQSPNHAQITLELLKEGFEACCDYIVVSTINPSDGTMNNDSVVIDGTNSTETFDNSLLVVAFQSDTSGRGNGFTLKFTGEGDVYEQQASQEYSYQLRHYNEPRGEIFYPSPSEWDDATPGRMEILVIAASVNINDISEADPLKLPTSIGWSSGVFKRDETANDNEEDNDDCTFESIVFYGYAYRTGWLAQKRLPSQNETWSCPSEIVIPKRSRIFTTTHSAFLAIYRHVPILNATIGFTYDKSADCGGVITGDAGEISYKEDGRYENYEECVWLVDAPQAKKIQFTLESSGLESCCDFVSIHSISHHGTLGPVTNIRWPEEDMQNETTSVVVDGPVAVVIFNSDYSVAGTGFRLSYSTKEITTEPPKYSFLLEHQHEVNKSHGYHYKVDENQIVVTAFSVDRAMFRSTPTIQINVTSLRGQIDKNCHSDMLSVYGVKGENGTLKMSQSFSAVNALKGEARERVVNETLDDQCSPLQNSQYSSCNGGISDCTDDAPEDNIVHINGTAFVAVFKSVNLSTGTLEHRGFSMISSVSVNKGDLHVDN